MEFEVKLTNRTPLALQPSHFYDHENEKQFADQSTFN